MLERTGSRRLSRQGLVLFGMVSCALFILLAMPVANVLAAALLFSASAFCASLAAPCGYAITIDMGGKHVAPVFSTMNMSGNVGAMILPAVIPYLIDKQTNDWTLVLLVLAGIYLAAGVFWVLLDPNGTVFKRRDKDPDARTSKASP
jgi:MFS family permease